MNHSLNSTISLALVISEHHTDQGLPPLEYPACEISIRVLINAAIKGDLETVDPRTWAMIVDAQEATRLLTLSESFGPENHFQQTTYLEAANRKLAEAVSWLV